jgi:hypothetical protein
LFFNLSLKLRNESAEDPNSFSSTTESIIAPVKNLKGFRILELPEMWPLLSPSESQLSLREERLNSTYSILRLCL